MGLGDRNIKKIRFIILHIKLGLQKKLMAQIAGIAECPPKWPPNYASALQSVQMQLLLLKLEIRSCSSYASIQTTLLATCTDFIAYQIQSKSPDA